MTDATLKFRVPAAFQQHQQHCDLLQEDHHMYMWIKGLCVRTVLLLPVSSSHHAPTVLQAQRHIQASVHI